MELLLTTPVDVDAVSCTKVKIIAATVDYRGDFIRMECQFGNTSGSDWVESSRVDAHVIRDVAQVGESGDDWYVAPTTKLNDFKTTSSSNNGEMSYDAIERSLYQYLIDEAIYPGTIV